MSNYQHQIAIDSDDSDDEDKRTLFCANLSDQVTEEILYELFMQAGPIEQVKIPKDMDGKRQKTFGFITYTHKCTIPYALELYDGIKLFKRNLVIKIRTGGESRNNQRHAAGNNDNTRPIIPYNMNSVETNLNIFMSGMPINPFAGQDMRSVGYNFNNVDPFVNNARNINRRDNDYLPKHSSRMQRHNDKPYSRHGHDYGRGNQDYNNRKNDRYAEQRRHR